MKSNAFEALNFVLSCSFILFILLVKPSEQNLIQLRCANQNGKSGGQWCIIQKQICILAQISNSVQNVVLKDTENDITEANITLNATSQTVRIAYESQNKDLCYFYLERNNETSILNNKFYSILSNSKYF